jgi:hypothetical protein
VSPAELRAAAVAQNDADHAAGLLPSRYVEDPGVLFQVARLLLRDGRAEREADLEQDGAA